jgi:hypothetical protein
MKTILSIAILAFLGACTATGPETAWGKPGISKFDYVTDLGICTGTAAMAQTGNGANTAGGLSGKNPDVQAGNNSDAARQTNIGGGAPGGGAAGTAVPVGGGGIYRESVPVDVANRAASQQTTQEMTSQRRRVDTLRSCYVELGYQEFKLTPEQRAHLGKLEKGSNAYLQYLSDIATDPALLKSAVAVAPAPGS